MTLRNLQYIKHTLAGHGLKVTHQRMVIYQVLQDTDTHPAAEGIYEKIKKIIPSISLGTIYKTLEVFVEKGLIKRINTSEGNMRYDARMDNHNHIYCTNTKEIIDFKDEELEMLIRDFLKRKKIGNFNLKEFRLHISGEKIDPGKHIEIT